MRIIYAFARFVNREFTKNYKINYKRISERFRFLLIQDDYPLFSTLLGAKRWIISSYFSIIKIFVTNRLFLHSLWTGAVLRLQMVTISFSLSILVTIIRPKPAKGPV